MFGTRAGTHEIWSTARDLCLIIIYLFENAPHFIPNDHNPNFVIIYLDGKWKSGIIYLHK